MFSGGVCPECGPSAVPLEVASRVDVPDRDATAGNPANQGLLVPDRGDDSRDRDANLVAPTFGLGVESAHDLPGVAHEALTHAEGTPTQSGADKKACAAGASPAPPTIVRPAGVELHPSLAPPAAVHGPVSEDPDIGTVSAEPDTTTGDAPDYMRRPLRTLTREEAVRLLLRLQARRMKADFATFIKGPGGLGIDGAWSVLEGETVLEWNFHHDAFCMHAQIMVEEWFLAGLPVEKVGPTLEAWEHMGRPYVAGYREHWQRPVEEFVQVGELKVYGCGGGKYKQRANDLAINVGPISLKSRIFMVFLPAWVWISLTATWEVCCSSGTPSNVSRDSLACRDLVQSAWYRETFDVDWQIRDDLNRVDKWGTGIRQENGSWLPLGSREARGSSGSVTGIHADAVLLDDPDDAAKVWSESERRDTMAFWLALGNRFKDLKRPVRMVIQQNLHEEDLSMRVVAAGAPRLAIPVEFDPSRRGKLVTAPFGWVDPRMTKGELIHELRFPPEVLAAERKRLGTHGFEAQYNCNPSPLEGGLIHRIWFNFFRIVDEDADDKPEQLAERPTGCKTRDKAPAFVLGRKRRRLGQRVGSLDLDTLTISVDATFGSTTATASAVGLLVIGNKAMRRFIFEDRTKPMTFLDTCAAIRALIKRWPAKRILIELKANGASIIESLKAEMQDGHLIGPDGDPITIVVEPITPEGGKESRAAAMVPEIEAGNVYLLDGAIWLEEFVGEVCVFPNAKRDDRVDALSQHMTYYREPDVVSKWKRMGATARA